MELLLAPMVLSNPTILILSSTIISSTEINVNADTAAINMMIITTFMSSRSSQEKNEALLPRVLVTL